MATTIKVKCQPCPRCGEAIVMDLDPIALMKFQAGAKVQTAFPDMPASEREALLTGYHPGCWDLDMASVNG